MIPVSSVKLPDEAERLVLEVIRSGMIAQGPMVRRFEEAFADLVGVRHAVAVNNGTTALIAALQALQLRPGDEVVTSPFTFAASLNAALEAGATVRFADIKADDFCIDPLTVAPLINERTTVLMPVHLYGQAADMSSLAAIAGEHSLAIVEDAAQAHGARVDGRGAGSYGLGCFSFYGTKNLTTGEGGMITTDNDQLADRLRVLRNQGMRARYQYEMPGYNYRLTDLQAALVIPQLVEYNDAVARRRHNAGRLTEGLANVPGLRLPVEMPGREHVWHQYTVLVDEQAPVTRDQLAERLVDRGVGNGIYYPRVVFDYDCYRRHDRVITTDVPVATSIAGCCLSLPVHQHLTDDDLEVVINTVKEVMKG